MGHPSNPERKRRPRLAASYGVATSRGYWCTSHPSPLWRAAAQRAFAACAAALVAHVCTSPRRGDLFFHTAVSALPCQSLPALPPPHWPRTGESGRPHHGECRVPRLPPPPPINVHARGSVRPRYAGWRCQIASTFSNPPPHASRGATPARRGRANTPSILCGWARGAPPMDRRPRPCPPFETRHWAGGALAALSPRSRDTRSQRGPRRGGPPPQSVVLPPTRQHRAPLRPFCGGGHRAGAGAHDASPGVHTLLDTRSYAGYRARRPPPAPPPRQGFRASAPPLRG